MKLKEAPRQASPDASISDVGFRNFTTVSNFHHLPPFQSIVSRNCIFSRHPRQLQKEWLLLVFKQTYLPDWMHKLFMSQYAIVLYSLSNKQLYEIWYFDKPIYIKQHKQEKEMKLSKHLKFTRHHAL